MVMKSQDISTVESRILGEVANAEIVRIHLREPLRHRLHIGPFYRLDMSLSPRLGGQKVQYCDRWQSHRYERTGNIFLLNGSERINGMSEPNDGAAVVCNISIDGMQNWFGGDLQWTDQHLLAGLNVEAPNITMLMTRLSNELRSPGFASKMLVELIAGQLAIELRRYCTTVREAPEAGGLAAWQLRTIDERLATSLTDASLSELAELCRISVRHLARAYRASRGSSIGQHIAVLRITDAQRRLLAGESIKAIAASVGFSSDSSFSYAFRRAVGLSPAAFRDSLV